MLWSQNRKARYEKDILSSQNLKTAQLKIRKNGRQSWCNLPQSGAKRQIYIYILGIYCLTSETNNREQRKRSKYIMEGTGRKFQIWKMRTSFSLPSARRPARCVGDRKPAGSAGFRGLPHHTPRGRSPGGQVLRGWGAVGTVATPGVVSRTCPANLLGGAACLQSCQVRSHFSADGHWGYSHLSTAVDNDAMNIMAAPFYIPTSTAVSGVRFLHILVNI